MARSLGSLVGARARWLAAVFWRLCGYRPVHVTLGPGRGRRPATVSVWVTLRDEQAMTLAALLERLRRQRWPGRGENRDLVDAILDSRGVFRRSILVAVNGRQVHSAEARIAVDDHIEVFIVPATSGG